MRVARIALIVMVLFALVAAARVLRPRYPAPRPMPSANTLARYPWPLVEPTYHPLSQRFPPPRGFTRVALPAGAWGTWLRGLPLRAPGTPVLTLGGTTRFPGSWPQLGAVVDIDVRPYQECADIVYRLRAEWLRLRGREAELRFRATDGSNIAWADWQRGVRPVPVGQKLIYLRKDAADASRTSFDRYLAALFNWCGSLSLSRDTAPVAPDDLAPGDMLIKPGNPGHTVLIVDVARNAAGRRQVLALQGWRPAQSIYVVSPAGRHGWFEVAPQRPLAVPGWGAFPWSALHRFTP